MVVFLCLDVWRSLTTSLLCAAAVFLWRSTPVEAASELFGHSLRSPPTIYGYTDWFMAGTVIPTPEKLIISPGVENRQGMLWHKTPLLTSDFEAKFSFKVSGPADSQVKQGFAFWYVYENATAALATLTDEYIHKQEAIVANEWPDKMKDGGFDLFGYRSKFDGLGVVFCNQWPDDRKASPLTTKLTPSVSAVVGDGSKAYSWPAEMPLESASKINYRDGTSIEVKVRVQAATIKVEVGSTVVLQGPATMKEGGYIGFTTNSGYEAVKGKAPAGDTIVLEKLTVTNYASKAGEEAPKPTEKPTEVPKDEKQDVLHATSAHKDHRDESEAIKDLTQSVFKLVVESEPLRQQMNQAINSLTQRVEVMERAFNLLKAEIDLRSGHSLDKEFEAMKKELTSLSNYASSEHQNRHSKLENLHKDLQSVKASSGDSGGFDVHLEKLTDSTQRTLDNLQTGHQRTFGVSLLAIAFIVIAGLALYNKFRCWEKKHIL